MADDKDQVDLDNVHKQQTRGQQPGGAAARGPQTDNPGGTFEPDALVPPYEGRKDTEGATGGGGHKVYEPEEHAPPPGEGREVSEEERGGMESTDMAPTSQHGVGDSTAESGEELAARDPEERAETGVHGESERPHGSPSKTDSVGAQDNVDPASPPTQRT